MNKEDIDKKALTQHSILEAEYFDIQPDGKGQRRILKAGKTEAEFNQRHGDIWKAHEAKLIAGDFIEMPKPPEPVRDLAAEIDDLKAKIKTLETR